MANGHSLYVSYHGVLEVGEAENKVLSWAPDAKTTDYGGGVFFTSPTMETSDSDFKWVETNLFVGQGHFVVEDTQTAVEYQYYKVVN